MAKHASSVNFRNLIKDLAEMYPYDVTEVVVVELVANSLDAKAARISINYDSKNKILVVEDNGTGMTASQFDEYHDFAAGLKKKGTGIGFAGLGAKISFNVADRVVTETKSKSFSGGSDWCLESNKNLVWNDVKSTRLCKQGTRVQVCFGPDTDVAYKSPEDLIKLLRRNYLPLMENRFLGLYQSLGFYSKNLKFEVNGSIIKPVSIATEYSLNNIRDFSPMRLGKKFGYGVLGLAKKEYPLSPDLCGVLFCTHGKVVKADWLNQFPGNIGPRIFGIVEIPNLINFLTTSKTDFIRRGRHKEFEELYGPVRQQFKEWLKEIGVEQSEVYDTDVSLKLEKELRKIIDEVPELSDFFGFRARKEILRPSPAGTIAAVLYEGIDPTFPAGDGVIKRPGPGFPDEGEHPGRTLQENKQNGQDKAKPISRTAKRGPKIAFKEMSNRVDLAWVEGSNIVINSGHAAFYKCKTDGVSKKFHCLFSIASAIQRFISAESEKPDLMFVDRMMAAWGKK